MHKLLSGWIRERLHTKTALNSEFLPSSHHEGHPARTEMRKYKYMHPGPSGQKHFASLLRSSGAACKVCALAYLYCSYPIPTC